MLNRPVFCCINYNVKSYLMKFSTFLVAVTYYFFSFKSQRFHSTFQWHDCTVFSCDRSCVVLYFGFVMKTVFLTSTFHFSSPSQWDGGREQLYWIELPPGLLKPQQCSRKNTFRLSRMHCNAGCCHFIKTNYQ